MKKRRVAFVIVLSLDLAVSLSGQTPSPTNPATIAVGDGTFDGTFLKPYKNLWRLTYTKPGRDPAVVASWSDEGEIVQIAGKPAMKRTQVAKYSKPAGLVSTVTNVFDLATMAPLTLDFKRTDTGGFNHREVHGTRVKFRQADSAKGQVHEGEVKLETRAFDFFAGMYGLLLVTGPLREGYTATLPSVAEDGVKLRWATYQVMNKETVNAGEGKEVEAWVVKSDDNGPMTFWLTKEPPYVIKLVYTNKDNVTATYDMM